MRFSVRNDATSIIIRRVRVRVCKVTCEKKMSLIFDFQGQFSFFAKSFFLKKINITLHPYQSDIDFFFKKINFAKKRKDVFFSLVGRSFAVSS